MLFKNREQAAELLVKKLNTYQRRSNVIVFAIPRGAVGMGKSIAQALFGAFDIIVVKKIGAPNNPELAIGAVGPENTVYWDLALCKVLRVDKRIMNYALRIKKKERRDREKVLRGNKPYPSIKDKTVIIVDDGVATGATSIVAAKFLKKQGVGKSILATPVIAKDTLKKVTDYYNEVVYLESSRDFHAVGQFYDKFPQVSDEEVVAILRNV